MEKVKVGVNMKNSQIEKNRIIQSIIPSTIFPLVFVAVMFFYYSQQLVTLNQWIATFVTAVLFGILLFFDIKRYDAWTRQMSIAASFLGVGSILLLFIIQFSGGNLNSIFYLTPIAAYAILIKFLVNERYAILSSVAIALFGAIIFSVSDTTILHVFLYLLLSQWFAIFIYQSIKDRSMLIKMSTSLLTVHIVMVLTFEFIEWTTLTTSQLLISILFSAG